MRFSSDDDELLRYWMFFVCWARTQHDTRVRICVALSATWHLFIRLLHTIKHQKRFISPTDSGSSRSAFRVSQCLFNKIVIYHVFWLPPPTTNSRRLLAWVSARCFVHSSQRAPKKKWKQMIIFTRRCLVDAPSLCAGALCCCHCCDTKCQSICIHYHHGLQIFAFS